ncbi:hypothetical protein V6N13_047844 [Hibiscus sabdariffa]|uniref:Uncharacterized protein n=1 Tax=Hibiscus sabdariffa TaxID=183260 RepID=A0ABR2F5H2_9ROSI
MLGKLMGDSGPSLYPIILMFNLVHANQGLCQSPCLFHRLGSFDVHRNGLQKLPFSLLVPYLKIAADELIDFSSYQLDGIWISSFILLGHLHILAVVNVPTLGKKMKETVSRSDSEIPLFLFCSYRTTAPLDQKRRIRYEFVRLDSSLEMPYYFICLLTEINITIPRVHFGLMKQQF